MSESAYSTYIEIPSKDLQATKAFYASVFGWEFEDFGSEYVAIHSADINGGFYLHNEVMNAQQGSALVVLYREDLAEVEQKVTAAGGKITLPTFSFPGGSRFHFTDATGNELAVWSKLNPL